MNTIKFAQVTSPVPAPQDTTTGTCGDQCNLIDPSTFRGTTGIVSLLLTLANFAIYIAGALAVVFLVYGGLRLIINPSGSSDNAKAARTIIFNAILGLIIVLVSYTIVTLVSTLVQGSITDVTGVPTS